MTIPNMHHTYHSSHGKLLYSLAEVSGPLSFLPLCYFFVLGLQYVLTVCEKKIMLTQNYDMGTDFIIIL